MRLVPALALALSVLASACSTPSSANEPASRQEATASPATTAAAPVGEVFGEALSNRPALPVAELLASPERFEGQVVRVSAPIRAVCQHRGCWMDIGPGAEADGRVHVRSLDHALAFPRDAVGKVAEVEGEVQAMPGASSCGGHEGDEATPGCGVAAAGRRVQLAVRGAVIR